MCLRLCDSLPLQIIPKTLAVNAAKDATDLVARLRAFHYTAQSKEGKGELARVRSRGAGPGRAVPGQWGT